MRVLVHPADTGACGHYRLIWPAMALKDTGADVLCGDPSASIEDWPEETKIYGKYIRDKQGEERMLGVVGEPNCDVFVCQRPLQATVADLLEHLQRTPIATVVELDDDFSSIHPMNVSFWAVHPGLSPKRNFAHMRRALDAADLITVSTPALRDAYGKFTTTPIKVIPNYVPRSYLTVEKAGLTRPYEYNGKLLLGWSGSIQTHPVDLQQVGGAVAQVLREHDNVRLTIVGTGQGVSRAFGTKAGGEFLTTGWIPLSQYPSVMKELDIGMVPLQMSQFNQGKSWLKGLEWASLGVPFVASPTRQYEALYQLGAGLIADDPRRWKSKLTALVENIDLRQDVAARGRVAANKLIIEDNLGRWLDAWHEALESKARSSR